MERTRVKITDNASFERFALGEAENGSVLARVCPYGVPDGRPGVLNGVKYRNTIYEPGAFDNWLTAHGIRDTKFLFDHGDADLPLVSGTENGTNALPIGTLRTLESREDGLYFEADFASSDLSQNVRELATSGGLTDVSFASNTVRASVERDGNRHVYEAEIWDVSIVVWGQFLSNAPILEVYAKKETHSDGMTSCAAALESAVYDCITDMFSDWRSDGVITGPELVTLTAVVGRMLETIQGELPDDIASRECDDGMPSWYARRLEKYTSKSAAEPEASEESTEPDEGQIAEDGNEEAPETRSARIRRRFAVLTTETEKLNA